MAKKISEETKQQMCSLYKQGLTQQQIAEKLGCSRPTVSNTLKRNNIKRKTKYKYIGVGKWEYGGLAYWHARCNMEKKHKSVGCFSFTEDGELEAAKAHDKALIDYFGTVPEIRHRLNFPGDYGLDMKDGQKQCRECKKIDAAEKFDPVANLCLECKKNISIEWEKENKNHRKKYHKKYNKNRDKDKYNEWRRGYSQYHRDNDVQFKLRKNLGNRLLRAVKAEYKAGSAVKDLGCSIESFKQYIEDKFYDDMSWDDWGKTWELDHIEPLCSFDFTDREQFLKAAHFTNMQPLTIKDHNEKSIKDNKKSLAR